MTKLKFNHMLALASTMALMSGSQAVYAQQTQQASDVEEVVVTGFRRSIQNSLAAKQSATTVVEAVYAEDIGKLPDSSIAETLARLPGLAGERRDGRTSGIAVRGFNENYVASTMNGRELLGIGDNRGVEFDLYPSEIVAGATVYKSAQATLVNQGLGGVVNLQTIRPLDHDDVISFNASYEQNGLKSANPDYDDNGHRLAFTASHKFADDTIGVALTVASMNSPSQEEQFRAWGYADTGAGSVVLGGQDSFVRSAEMKRDTVAAVVQFKPNDQLDVVVDGLSIDFKDSKVKRGLEEGFAWGGGTTNTFGDVENGLATTGTSTGFDSVIRNDAEVKDGELTAFGINAKYQLTDTLLITADIATSNSKKDLKDLESYSGTGRDGSGAGAARSWVMTSTGAKFTDLPGQPDYSDASIIKLAGPQNWGGAIGPVFPDEDGNYRNNQQDGFINNPSFDEDLDTFRLQADAEVEFSIIKGLKAGVNYSDRSKTKVNYGAFLTSPDYFTAEGLDWDFTDGPIPVDLTTEGDGPVPDEYIVGTADLGFLGLGKILAYDSVGLYDDGYYNELSAGLFQPDRLGDTYTVNEKVTTLFGMAEFETGILTGDVGLQVVRTDQSSSGYDTFTGGDGLVIATPVSDGSKYTKLLPSLNLNFQLTDDQVLRFATSKIISRARMDDMKPNNVIGFDFDTYKRTHNDPDNSAWSHTRGEPKLQPLEAITYDLSYEYYFADDGFASATYFYKDLLNWHSEYNTYENFSSYFIPGYHDANLPDGEDFLSEDGKFTQTYEAGSGNVGGTEVQVSYPFHLINESLDGLGVIASATFLTGSIEVDGAKQAVPGLSKESYQLTVYYEKSGFEFRVSGRKRSEFLTEERGLSLSLVPVTDQGGTLVDAQIGYNFSESGITALEGLTVNLQAQNITDEDTVLTAANDSRLVSRAQHFGANYLLGVNYKF